VDCTNDTEKAIQYTVSNLPTFLAVDEIGTPIDRRSGFLSELNFQKWLDSLK
jgi:thioredoxin-like negative regulator of GroEL